MSPAGHALDRRLYDLRSTQHAVLSDLVDLDGDATYAQLARGRLSGTTASRAAPALTWVAELHRGLEPLARLLDEVGVLRNTGHVDDRRATELVALLNSATIVVTAAAPLSPPPLPDDETEIVPAGGTRPVTAQELLVAADDAAAALRELVAEIEAVWRHFPARVERAMAEADRLGAELPLNRAVAAARTTLVALSTRVAEDPLGADDDLADVQAALDAAANVGASTVPLRDALAAAAETVAEVETLLGAGRDALARSRTEIADPYGLLDPVDPAVLTGERGLRPWLARLERLVAEGDVRLAERGLDSWRALAAQTLAAARQVADANAAPIRRRRELLGLLQAARVKAGAAGRAEDPHLAALALRAERALAVPCDLASAETEVESYLHELRHSPTPAQATAHTRPAPAPAGWNEMSA